MSTAKPAPGNAGQEPQPFDLDRFERLALSRHRGEVEQAFGLLHQLLALMEQSRGALPAGLSTQRSPGGPATPELERLTLLWTRIAHAISGLFLHPGFETLNFEGLWALLLLHKQLASIFHASSLETADACILAFDRAEPGQPFTIAEGDLPKVLLLYSLESRLELELITSFEPVNRQAVLASCIALCCTIFCGSERAYSRREELLRYLCRQLEQHELEGQMLHLLTVNPYMYCSYASSADKHAIKGLIHRQWRQRLASQGISDLVRRGEAWPQPARHALPTDKPVLLILHEWMGTGHAMNRCYGPFLQALRRRFHTVGMGLQRATGMDDQALALFDSYVPLPEAVPIPQTVRTIWSWCRRHQPAAVYYPSIGMGSHTVAAASLRLAPVQLMSAGHPATTQNSEIDYLLVPDDFDLDCNQIHEQLLLVPPESIAWSHHPRQDNNRPIPYADVRHRNLQPGYTTQVIVSASAMKLGWPFLSFLREVHQRVQGQVFWHIFAGEARGAAHLEIRNCVRALLGEFCSVYPHLDYADYLVALRVGDVFLTPFPFGNANTFYDYSRAQIVGACLRGHELQSAGDAAFLEMLGFPPELIAADRHAYVDVAARLIEEPQWRLELHERIYGEHAPQSAAFTEGDPSLMVEAVHALLNEPHATTA